MWEDAGLPAGELAADTALLDGLAQLADAQHRHDPDGEPENDDLGRPTVDVRERLSGDGGDHDPGREGLDVGFHLWARGVVDGD
jgi:hypothetical protein